jgi:hypothetical protein
MRSRIERVIGGSLRVCVGKYLPHPFDPLSTYVERGNIRGEGKLKPVLVPPPVPHPFDPLSTYVERGNYLESSMPGGSPVVPPLHVSGEGDRG